MSPFVVVLFVCRTIVLVCIYYCSSYSYYLSSTGVLFVATTICVSEAPETQHVLFVVVLFVCPTTTNWEWMCTVCGHYHLCVQSTRTKVVYRTKINCV